MKDEGQNTRSRCRLGKEVKAARPKSSNVDQPPYCEPTAQTDSQAHSEHTFARWQRSKDDFTETGPQHAYTSKSIDTGGTKAFLFRQQVLESARYVPPRKLCSLIFLVSRYVCVLSPAIVLKSYSSCSSSYCAVGLMARSRCRRYFVEEKE